MRFSLRNYNASLLVASFLYFLISTTGFAPSPRSTLTQSQIPCKTILFTTKENNYNDDAFGFIFLGGSAAAQDPVFGAIFLSLSVAAVIATKLEVLPVNKQVPAAVAGVTLLVTPLISLALPEEMLGVDLIPSDNGRLIELIFCTVSMMYGFVFSSSEDAI